MFFHVVTIFMALYSCVYPYFQLELFSSTLKISFNISYSTGVLGMDTFSFCISEKVFVPSSSLKDIFAEYKFLGKTLSFSNFKMLLHCLILALFPMRNFLSFLPLLLCTWCVFFYLPAFKIFSSLLILGNLVLMCLSVDFLCFLCLEFIELLRSLVL